MAPILHVNGERIPSGDLRLQARVEYRQTFHRDVVIDMWCYRRFSHNEGYEPKSTQPLMYTRSAPIPRFRHPIYEGRLIEQGVVQVRHPRGRGRGNSCACFEEGVRAGKELTSPTKRQTGSTDAGPG